MKTFIEQEKELLNTFLNSGFKRYKNSIFYESNKVNLLELIITPECNQKCNYCYINKYGDELYPKEERINNETILNNINIIMDYFIKEKKFIFSTLSLFAGDLYGQNLLFETLDILLPYYEYLKINIPEHPPFTIIIPSSLWFIPVDNMAAEKIYLYQNKFLKYNTHLRFSWSHDGLFSLDEREKKNLSEEDYKKLFTFCEKSKTGIHPILSANKINNAIENYEWWKNMYKTYLPHNFDMYPIPLVCRNPEEWDEESIQKYIEYMKYRLDDLKAIFNNDIEELTDYIFKDRLEQENFTADFFDIYLPVDQGRMKCSFQNSLIIQINNLSIVPCHRLTYKGLVAAKYIVQDNKIIDFIPMNVSQYIDSKTHRVDLGVKCIDCWNNQTCLHGCLGAQREYSGEMYIPIPSVCNLFKAQTIFVLNYFIENNIFDIALQKGYIKENSIYTTLKNEMEQKGWNKLITF